LTTEAATVDGRKNSLDKDKYKKAQFNCVVVQWFQQWHDIVVQWLR